MYLNKVKKGFTLVELLVVISIIGILSATIFVGAQSYRKRAKDDRIKSDLMQFRALAETEYEKNEGTGDAGTYKNVRYLRVPSESPTPGTYRPEWRSLMDDIANNGGSLNASWLDLPGSNPLDYTKFAAASTLNNGTWCVDSSNYSASGTTAASSGVCTP